MRVLIVRDDGDLRRVERAIAEFEGRPPSERLRKSCLLQALRQERAELLRCNPHLRGSGPPVDGGIHPVWQTARRPAAAVALQAAAAGAIVGRTEKSGLPPRCLASPDC